MADKCIGHLTLDTSKVNSKIREINNLLNSIGKDVKLNITDQVATQIDKIKVELEKGVAKINEALTKIGSNVGVKFDIAKEVKSQLDKMFQEIEKGTKQIQAAAKNAADSLDKMGGKKVNDQHLRNLVQLYKELYTVQKQAEQARQAGNTDNIAYYERLATAIRKKINDENESIKQSGQSVTQLTKEAQATQAVVNARRALVAAKNTTAYKAEQANTKEIEKATQAYIKMIEAKNKLKELEAQSKQNTKEYEQAAAAAGKASDAFQKYSKDAREAAKASTEAKLVAGDLKHVLSATAEEAGANKTLTEVKQKYFELTDAIKNYQSASKQKNTDDMAVWQSKINAIMQEVGAIQQIVQDSNMEAGIKQQILNIIQQCTTAENQHRGAVAQSARAAKDLETQMTSILTRMFSLMAVIRTVNSLINNTVEYVSSYYDKMNEIQIITQKSSTEVAKLGETYRDIAESMNVSSLSMADAAIYFTRQGLPAEEIENRLRNVTMYAKTANVEFKQASEIITAVVNSMGLVEQEAEDGRNATQRVADVFLKVGDNAATSGQEIGEAMQKAAAAAGAFGVSFEWLASYIAAVSETTRQEARTIGTALNTIIARLHSIRTSGYNAEDETKVNDIAKALHTVDIELMDQQGNWRDMEDIFQDVAGIWDTLNGKQKSYIATTMAGVKQQNVFLALMNDMSKGIEKGSRAYELHELAINSAGTAEQKYATYMDSVQAAQERLTIAQEKFYSLLDASVIKNWNDALAGYVNMIATGAEKMGSWTIILPVIIGLITAVTIAIKNAGTASALFATIWESHPILVAISAALAVATTLITVINAVTSSVETQEERLSKANETLSASNQKLKEYISLQGKANAMFDDLGNSEGNEKLKEYNSLLDELGGLSTTARQAVDDFKKGLIDQKEAAEKVNDELDKYIKQQREVSSLAFLKKMQNTPTDERTTIARELQKQGVNSATFGAMLLAGSNGPTLDERENNYRIYEGVDQAAFFKAEALNELIDEYEKVFDTIKDENEKWYQIGRAVWAEYFEGAESSSAYLTDKVNKLIEETLNNATIGMTNGEKGLLRERLLDMVFGTDGVLNDDEAKNYSSVIETFLKELYADGFEISKDDIAQYVEKLLRKIAEVSGEHLNLNGDMLLWDELDLETTQLVYDLVKTGTALSNIKQIMSESKSVDEFTEKLKNMNTTLGGDGPKSADEEILSIDKLVKNIKASIKDVKALDDALQTLNRGEDIEFDDLIDLVSAHPELLTVINDVESLKKKLEELKGTGRENIWHDAQNMLLDDRTVMENSSYRGEMTDEKAKNPILTLRDYMKTLDEGSEAYNELTYYLAQSTANLLVASGDINKIDIDKIKELQSLLFSNSNADLNNRPTIDAKELAKAGWDNVGEGIATVFTSTYTAGESKDAGLRFDEDVLISLTPILANGEVLSPKSLNDYVEYLLENSGDIDQLWETDRDTAHGGKGLLIDVTAVASDESFDEAKAKVNGLMELLHKLQELLYSKPESEKSWLEEQAEAAAKAAALEWAKSNNYTDQIAELQTALNDSNGGIAQAMEIWNSYDEELQKAIAKEYPDLIQALAQTEKALDKTDDKTGDATKATENLSKALRDASRYASATTFEKTAKAIKQLREGTISAADAYDTFYSEVDKVTKAQEDINDVTQKMANGADIAASDVSNLASVLGISADQILQNFPEAEALFNNLISETGELRTMFDALNEAAFIRITGTSDVDFSALQEGIISTENMTQEMLDLLAKTGQWTVETIPLDGLAWVLENGQWIQKQLQGMQQVLKPTGNNPYKGTSATGSRSTGSSGKRSGGGGGGGSNKNNTKNEKSEIEIMLENMKKINDLLKQQQEYYSAQSKYYNTTGQLQGVIAYSEKEIEVLGRENKVLEQNIKQIEKKLKAKKAELNSMSATDENYQQVLSDLEKLETAHQEYTVAIVNNKTAMENLKQTIEETRNKIRDMEIDIKNEIYQAIEDREKRKESMLKNEIAMENEILDVIKRRYEIERDKIIENTDARIEALQEERDLLREQLDIRKEMEEKEEKAAKLAQLEAQYQRIIADPTRKKEAQKIKDQIDSLRKDMAWDAAEDEVKAQEDSINQQINSLEDYKQYIEEYYEDLFEHPQQLIEEMRNIMTQTDEEIIEWLKENEEAYANSSENTQQSMVENWQQTLDDMRGRIKTYWDEVEEIYAEGDNAIIKFLTENSDKYARAGKQQAQKYVSEWKKQLEDLHKALEQVFTVQAPTYVGYVGGSGGSGGSSGGGGGGGGGGRTTPVVNQDKYFEIYDERGIKTNYVVKAKDLATAKSKTKSAIGSYYHAGGSGYTSKPSWARTVYKQGGIADFTGPAWLDGTKQDPERVLSPYQTKLFETMVQALEKMSTISVPAMPKMGDIQTGSGGNVSVGDIVVNVDNLDTDDDYEELADKVSKVLMERIGQTAVVSGIRVSTF